MAHIRVTCIHKEGGTSSGLLFADDKTFVQFPGYTEVGLSENRALHLVETVDQIESLIAEQAG